MLKTHSHVLFLIILLVMAAFCVGCDERVRVMVPPQAPVAGINTIAILDFTNASIDPGVGLEFATELGRIVQEAKIYTVLDRVTTAAVLAKHGIQTTETADRATAIKLGELLQCDAIVVGEITHYLEDVHLEIPYRVGSTTSDGKTPTWFVGVTTRVQITANVRVIDTHTGNIIWTKRVSEGDETGSTTVLNWHFDAPPPESILPKPSKYNVPAVRQAAIEKTVSAFAADILPGYRYEWRKKDTTTPVPIPVN